MAIQMYNYFFTQLLLFLQTESEYKSHFNGPSPSNNLPPPPTHSSHSSHIENTNLPQYMDWRTKNAVTAVKNEVSEVKHNYYLSLIM